MGMMGEFREITPTFLEKLKADASLVEAAVLARPGISPDSSDLEIVLAQMPPAQREVTRRTLEHMTDDMRQKMKEMAAKAAGGFREMATQVSAADAMQLGASLSIEKAWHGVHFLLSGAVDSTSDPLGQAILGGTEIGGDLGDGPARYHDPRTVANIAAELEKVAPKELRNRYDGKTFSANRVYPGNWEDPEQLDWLIQAYEDVRSFYAAVAKRGNAVLAYIG